MNEFLAPVFSELSRDISFVRAVASTNGSVFPSEADVADNPVPRVLLRPQPKHQWSAVRELRNREYGFTKTSKKFTRDFYSSLHAVQHLDAHCKLQTHTERINTVAFNQNGTKIVSGSDDMTAVVYDWQAGKPLTSFDTGHTSNVFNCQFLPLCNDSHIATCSRDGQVRLASQTSNGQYESTRRLAQHTKSCNMLATLPHTPHVLLSAGKDGSIFSMDVREPNPENLLHCVRENWSRVCLYSIQAHPMTGNEIIVAGDNFGVHMYDRRSIRKDGSNVIKFCPSMPVEPREDRDGLVGVRKENLPTSFVGPYISCAVFNYDGSEVLSSYNSEDIYLFETKRGDPNKFTHKYEGHINSKTVKGVNFFGEKSEYIMSGSDCGHIFFWEKETEAIVRWVRGDARGVVNRIEAHPHLPVVASCGLDLDVKVWLPCLDQDPDMTNIQKTVALNLKKKYFWNAQKSKVSSDLSKFFGDHANEEYLRVLRSPECLEQFGAAVKLFFGF